MKAAESAFQPNWSFNRLPAAVLLRLLLRRLLEVVPDGSAADGHIAEEFLGD